MIKYIILLLSVYLLITSLCFAVVDVDTDGGQSFTHNGSFTIGGTGFGTKSPAAPYFYDNFESGADGNALSGNTGTVGSSVWTDFGIDQFQPAYSDTLPYGVGDLSAYKQSNGDDFGVSGINGLNSEEMFLSYKYRWSKTAGTPPQSTVVKASRTTNSGGWYNENPRLQLQTNLYGGTWTYFSYNNCDGFPGSDTVNQNLPDVWHSIDMYMKMSTPSVADGEIITRSDYNYGYNSDTLITRTSTCSTAIIDSFILPMDVANNSAADYTFHSDNIYFDITQARVEIGNADTFDACTHREIQIPTAWSATSATFTVNIGTFVTDDMVYVYLIDPDGLVNANGYPVTIGAVSTDPTITFSGSGTTVEVNTPVVMNCIAEASAGRTITGATSSPSVTWTCDDGTCDEQTEAMSATTNTLSEGLNSYVATVTDSESDTGQNTFTITYTPATGSCDTAHYWLCETQSPCESAGSLFWWEDACRTIAEPTDWAGSNLITTNEDFSLWTAGLPDDWGTGTPANIAEVPEGVRTFNAGAVKRQILEDTKTYRYAVNLIIITEGSLEEYHESTSTYYDTVSTITGSFTLGTVTDHSIYFKAHAGENDVIFNDVVVKEITDLPTGSFTGACINCP